jgi:large subunit ribosomal protein L3
MNGLLGKKLGMSRIFSEAGEDFPVTVLQVGPCYITALRNNQSSGYDAVQLGFEEIPERKVKKPILGQFKKHNLNTFRYLREFRSTPEQVAVYNVGDEIKVDFFAEGEVVKVSGISKGKGFQGTVKRHGFGGGPKTHGQSDRLRAPGSIGQSSYPSRVFKGLKMAGRMGNEKVTVRNLRIIKVDVENNVLIVRGAVPGAKNGLVRISK